MSKKNSNKLNNFLDSLCSKRILDKSIEILISNGIDKKTAQQIIMDNPSAFRFLEEDLEVEVLKDIDSASSDEIYEPLPEECPIKFAGTDESDFEFKKTPSEIDESMCFQVPSSSSTQESLASTSNYSEAEVIYSSPEKTDSSANHPPGEDVTEVSENIVSNNTRPLSGLSSNTSDESI